VLTSADLTITDNDGYTLIDVTTGASDRTITWPTIADNIGRRIAVRKADSGAGHVINDAEGAELFRLIGGGTTLTFELWMQGDFVEFYDDGTDWVKLTPDYLHLLDESDRNTDWDVNVNPTTSWVEYDLSARVPKGTKALMGYLRISNTDVNAMLQFRDGVSTESDNERTRTIMNGGGTGHTLGLGGITIKATDGIFDVKEESADTEVVLCHFQVWGYYL